MRKLKEVLRLHSLGLSQHQIARSCSISQSTVHEYVSAAQAAGVRWPLPDNWDEQQIEQALFPRRPAPSVWRKHPEPDWSKVHEDLQTHKELTLQLVWQEGRENNPEGYGYSRFCELYRRWLKKLDLVLRQEHRAGEKMFVDYAGATIPIHDPQSGEVHAAAVFVAVLGASSYTFAEATTGQDLRNWIGSHQRAFEFFGGTTEVVVPDFVPGHIIVFLWRIVLCGHWRASPRWSRWRAWIWQHNLQRESSHFSRSGSLLHPAAGRRSGEESTGGRHAATAACLVRNVISA